MACEACTIRCDSTRNRANEQLLLLNFRPNSQVNEAAKVGIYLAEFQVGASLSPSDAREKTREEAQAGNEEVSKRYVGGGDARCGIGWCVRSEAGSGQATTKGKDSCGHQQQQRQPTTAE